MRAKGWRGCRYSAGAAHAFIMSQGRIVVRECAATQIGDPTGGVALLVRSAELACRTSWGSDRWEPQPGDFSLDIKIWGPFGPNTPTDDFPGDLIALLMSM